MHVNYDIFVCIGPLLSRNVLLLVLKARDLFNGKHTVLRMFFVCFNLFSRFFFRAGPSAKLVFIGRALFRINRKVPTRSGSRTQLNKAANAYIQKYLFLFSFSLLKRRGLIGAIKKLLKRDLPESTLRLVGRNSEKKRRRRKRYRDREHRWRSLATLFLQMCYTNLERATKAGTNFSLSPILSSFSSTPKNVFLFNCYHFTLFFCTRDMQARRILDRGDDSLSIKNTLWRITFRNGKRELKLSNNVNADAARFVQQRLL